MKYEKVTYRGALLVLSLLVCWAKDGPIKLI